MLIAEYTVLSSILPGHQNWIEGVGVVLVLIGCWTPSIVEIIASTGKDLDTTEEMIQMNNRGAEQTFVGGNANPLGGGDNRSIEIVQMFPKTV